MQKLVVIGVALWIGLSACEGERKSPHENVASENIKLSYGRPYKKGREIYGGLVKYGTVWRTGADEATEITFAKDGTFGGQAVKAGSYSLYTIPGKEKWTVILNSQTGQSGTVYNQNKDVLRVDGSVRELDGIVEQLTLRFDSTNMYIEWDKTQVYLPVNFR